jgi:hypothetical protein
MNEQSGVLRPAIEAYLHDKHMTPIQVATVRAYLRQWISAPAWKGPMIDVLRTAVEEIIERDDITRWLARAESCGIDPL